MTKRVLHLVGSASSDFFCDLSRLYASDCLVSTADSAKYEFVIAYVTPDLRWRFPKDLSKSAIAEATPMALPNALKHLVALDVDVMIPQMFCLPGMTTYRSLFDLLQIPYVGNAAEIMALTANKAKTKAVVQAAGVSVPNGQVIRPGDALSILAPAVVKPADADNSLGVTFVRNAREFDLAVSTAFSHSDQVLVEDFIELGREVRCGVLDIGGQLICLPLEEYRVDPQTAIRSEADKLQRNSEGNLELVAKDHAKAWTVDIDDPITQRVWELAKICHAALGCRHYSLFDFRIDPSGQPWFLEAGLYCSFATDSVISTMARAAGIDVAELFAQSVDEVLASNQSLARQTLR